MASVEVLLSMKISNDSYTRLNIHLVLILILIKQSSVFCCYRELHATFRCLLYPDGWQSPCQLSILNLLEVYNGVSPTSVSHGKRDTIIHSCLGQLLLEIPIHMLPNFMNQELLRMCSPKNGIHLWMLRFMGCHLLQWNIDHFLR